MSVVLARINLQLKISPSPSGTWRDVRVDRTLFLAWGGETLLAILPFIGRSLFVIYAYAMKLRAPNNAASIKRKGGLILCDPFNSSAEIRSW